MATLADGELTSVVEPGLGVRDAYTIPIPESELTLTDIQTITIVNDDTAMGYTFDRVSLQSGSVPMATLLATLPGLGTMGI